LGLAREGRPYENKQPTKSTQVDFVRGESIAIVRGKEAGSHRRENHYICEIKTKETSRKKKKKNLMSLEPSSNILGHGYGVKQATISNQIRLLYRKRTLPHGWI